MNTRSVFENDETISSLLQDMYLIMTTREVSYNYKVGILKLWNNFEILKTFEN